MRRQCNLWPLSDKARGLLAFGRISEVTTKGLMLRATTQLEKNEMAIRAALAHVHSTGAIVTHAEVAKRTRISQGYISRSCDERVLLRVIDDR